MDLTSGKILSLAKNENVFLSGQQIYNENSITDYEILADNIYSFVIKGAFKSYNVKISLDDEQVGQDCNCEGQNILNGVCKHVVACLFFIMEGKVSISTKNDLRVHTLNDYFKNTYFNHFDDLVHKSSKHLMNNNYQIIFHVDFSDSIYIEVYIKIKKEIKIINLENFITTILKNKKFKLERNYISKYDFYRSEIFLSFFESREYIIINERLKITDLDFFFNFFENKILHSKNNVQVLDLKDSSIKFDVTPIYSENTIEKLIMFKHFEYRIYESNKNNYLFTNYQFIKITNDSLDILQQIEKLFAELDQVVFNDDEIINFLKFGLPTLYNHNLISDQTYNRLLSFTHFNKIDLILDFKDKKIVATILLDGEVGENEVTIKIAKILEIYNFTNDGKSYSSKDFINFIEYGIDSLLSHDDIKNSVNFVYTSSFAVKKSLKISEPTISFSNNFFEMTFPDISLPEMLKILSHYKANKTLYELENGSFYNLYDDENREVLQMLVDLSLSSNDIEDDKILINKYKIYYLNSKVSKKYFDESSISKIENLINSKVDKTSKLDDILRDYQVDGFKWLYNLYVNSLSGILADEMGLGKTVQIISLLMELESDKKVLIVTPKSLIYNWQFEINKFTDLKCTLVEGASENRAELIKENHSIYITSYMTLKNDIKFYENIPFELVIIDEAQYIKNDTTKTKRALRKLQARSKFALTGTPIENNLLDLWSIIDFLLPNLLSTKVKFKEEFITNENNDLLKAIISPFILRRCKVNVLNELPEKIYQNYYCDLSPEQEKIYNSLMIDVKYKVDLNSKIDIFHVLTRLRQVCCHPKLFLDYDGDCIKFEQTIDLITMCIANGQKVLLFSQFTKMLDIFEQKIKELSYKYYRIDGKTKADNRVEYASNFNENEEPSIFLISLKAGGTGLNLQTANVVIHYDQWWNPAVIEQATDRAHRIGQQKNLQIFNMITKGTIEEKILRLQNLKKQLSNDILDNPNSQALSVDELKEILL